jgi:hypothetical protein
LGKNSVVQQMLNSGSFNPRQRVIIAVTVNGQTEVLMDGIITKQELAPSSAPGKSVLAITGLDLTALMDFIDLTDIPYPAFPEFVIVEAILDKYAVLGVVPTISLPLWPTRPRLRFQEKLSGGSRQPSLVSRLIAWSRSSKRFLRSMRSWVWFR